MELGAIFLLLVVLVIVVLFVARPFIEHWGIEVQGSREISPLLAERERALNALQELDFDYGLGKVPADEYSSQRAGLLQKGSDVLRRLDELQVARISPVEEPVNPDTAQQSARQLSDDDLEDLIAKRRALRPKKSAGFCSKCGKPILQSDQFCPSCGQVVNSMQSISNK
jgi:hypothetical protein